MRAPTDIKCRRPSCLLTPSAACRRAFRHQALPVIVPPYTQRRLPWSPRSRAWPAFQLLCIPARMPMPPSPSSSLRISHRRLPRLQLHRQAAVPASWFFYIPFQPWRHPTRSWTALMLYWLMWPYQWTSYSIDSSRSWLTSSEKCSLHFSACKPRLTILRKVWC
jgi:hypothetical protein